MAVRRLDKQRDCDEEFERLRALQNALPADIQDDRCRSPERGLVSRSEACHRGRSHVK